MVERRHQAYAAGVDETTSPCQIVGPGADAVNRHVRLMRPAPHQQTIYLGHALSRPQQLGSTAEGRRVAVAVNLARLLLALAALGAWGAVAGAWGG